MEWERLCSECYRYLDSSGLSDRLRDSRFKSILCLYWWQWRMLGDRSDSLLCRDCRLCLYEWCKQSYCLHYLYRSARVEYYLDLLRVGSRCHDEFGELQRDLAE